MYSRSAHTLNNTETTNTRMHSVQWLILKLCFVIVCLVVLFAFFYILDENSVNLNVTYTGMCSHPAILC